MVALNFSPEFAAAVESGRKTQTIRQTARCKPGDRLQLFTGQRTKACRKLGEGICTEVLPVTLRWPYVTLGADALGFGASYEFARLDGFPDYVTMWKWFVSRYGLPGGGSFSGFAHRWKKEAQENE